MKRLTVVVSLLCISACATPPEPKLELKLDMSDVGLEGIPKSMRTRENDIACARVAKYADGVNMLRIAGVLKEDLPHPVLDFDAEVVKNAVYKNRGIYDILWNCYTLGPENLSVTLK